MKSLIKSKLDSSPPWFEPARSTNVIKLVIEANENAEVCKQITKENIYLVLILET